MPVIGIKPSWFGARCHAGSSPVYPTNIIKFDIPDRWVKLALELQVIRKLNHVTLAEDVIIECALRKILHRLKLEYIGRDGTELYYWLLSIMVIISALYPEDLGSIPREAS